MFSEQDFTAIPASLTESAYRRLRHEIITGVYTPGEKLRVEHLRQQYQIGAGTLREALSRLVGDTLVVAQEQRGFRVAPLSLADLEDLTRTRILMESEALRQSIAAGDDAWEARVVAAFHTLGRVEERLNRKVPSSLADEWEHRNGAFHRALLSACLSSWLQRFLDILYHQSERYRRISLITQTIPRDVHAEHGAIFEAALARDTKKAVSLNAHHIVLTLEAIRALPADIFQKPRARSAGSTAK